MSARTTMALAIVLGSLAAAEPAEGREEPQAPARPHPEDTSRITDEYIPLLVEGALERPKPILELGTPFLGSGGIRRGFTVPGGAVWQPSFILFGTFRTALSVADDVERTTTQWANRLDVFGNLYLTATERLVFGLRPLDETVDGTRRFSGYTSLSPDPADAGGWNDALNFDWDTVTHLFFEGDLQELFPALDIQDRHALDLGLAIGRQPIVFQEGLLIDDFVDAIGVARNNLKPSGTANLRITGLWAWNGINRNAPAARSTNRNPEADDAWLAGVFTETDFRATTMAIDALYVRGGTFVLPAEDGAPGMPVDAAIPATDGVYVGVSFVQRIKGINTAFRVVGSAPVGEETPDGNAAGIGDPAAGGAVLFSELSWTPHRGHNLFYLNGFWAIDEYRAAALDPLVPGPLARAGILFSGVGLGNYGAALSPTADEAAGAAFGHQLFFAHGRRQLLLEAGGRYSTRACGDDEVGCAPQSAAAGGRYQMAAGRRAVFVFDGYVAYDELRGARTRDSRVRSGGRAELLIKF